MNKEKTELTERDYLTVATALRIAFQEIMHKKDLTNFQPLLNNISDLYFYFNSKAQNNWIKGEKKMKEKYQTQFTGECDTCGRKQLPATMSLCNDCATEEESK